MSKVFTSDKIEINIVSRFLVYKEYDGENDVWVARGLEYNIVAQGKTLDRVKRRFKHTLIGQICVDIMNSREPLEYFNEAPREFWDQFEQGNRHYQTKVSGEIWHTPSQSSQPSQNSESELSKNFNALATT